MSTYMKIMSDYAGLLMLGSFGRFFSDHGKIWFIMTNHKFLILSICKFDLIIVTISQHKDKTYFI